MIRHLPQIALVVATTVFLSPSTLGQEHRTYALFGLDLPDNGPFPSDRYTVFDDAENTGRRVSLPPPSATCEVSISECEDLAVINELDGFNLQPRLSIPFSGPIEPSTVTSDTVFLVSLGSTVPGQDFMPRGTKVGIDQVVWDTFTNTLHVESDELLAQHTRFALIVTRGIRDWNGFPVKASDDFRRFLTIDRADYKIALVEAMQAAWHHGVTPGDVVVASVFTTQSATAVLEKIRGQIHAATADPADFLLGPNSERTVFSLDGITSIAWRQHTRVDPPTFTPVALNLSLLRNTYPGAVGSLAFGKYLSPDYQIHPGEYIPAVGTRSGTPTVQRMNEIYFNLFLPSGPKPPNGWPVVIFGHGNGGSKNVPPLNVASSMASHGLATISINAVGHGFGPLGTLSVFRTLGTPITFDDGGRGIDQDGDSAIDSNEGLATARPRKMLVWSDGYRQTTADLMQLARVVDAGMDVDGDGQRDLDSARIYYFGTSLGGAYGTVFVAVEPAVRAGVLNVPADAGRFAMLGPVVRSVPGLHLAFREPSLLNAPGIAVLAGLAVTPPLFDENFPLREGTPLAVELADGTTRVIQSPVTNTIPGAIAIQEMLDHYEWAYQAGNPIAYAPHLQTAPLSGMPAKPVIVQIAKGDETAPNPTATALVRAGNLKEWTLFYRHDLARLDIPALPRNSHTFATGLAIFGAIALGAQEQAAIFLASDGAVDIRPTATRYFEFPIAGPLPEDLNFIVP